MKLTTNTFKKIEVFFLTYYFGPLCCRLPVRIMLRELIPRPEGMHDHPVNGQFVCHTDLTITLIIESRYRSSSGAQYEKKIRYERHPRKGCRRERDRSGIEGWLGAQHRIPCN